MNTIKLGSHEPDVILLQTYLEVNPDSDFGPKTDDALRKFQSLSGLVADGICGPKSWEALSEAFDIDGITDEDYIKAASILGVPVATVKAVAEVESGSAGAFRKSRRPVCLFEGHIFWSELKKRGIDSNKITGHSGILYPKWDKSKYSGGEKEWDRLEEAFKINPDAALSSASLGLFQIMGFNWKATGCNSIYDYYSKSFISEGSQLELFCGFINSQGLGKYLKNLDWAGFAKKYNGPKYYENRYSEKLEIAYKKYNY